MNGEVNGTMEEPMETSLPASPVNTQTFNKVTSDDCEISKSQEENVDSSETNNHVDNELMKEESEDMSAEGSGHDDDADGDLDDPASTSQNLNTVPKQESSNNITDDPVENNCNNSNESYPESMTSSHAKTENMEQDIIPCAEENSKDRETDNNCSRTVIVETDDEVDSEEDSSEEGSVLSVEARAEEPVSIDSDSDIDGADDTSQESQTKDKSNDIIILENDNRPDDQNGNSLDSESPEVHEIISDNDNDDCVLTNDEKSSSNDSKVKLRRSSRAIKRKIYIDEEMENGGNGSDIEEVEVEDPLNRKSKPIVINDTKALVAMAVKQAKLGVSNQNQKKEPTVVIIDTNSIISGKTVMPAPAKTSVATMSAENLYQSIVARGTTVTPVSSKTNTCSSTVTQNATQAAQTSILPSLTDDMFVVEAPSFIVPYVYEKPSVKPFREFVDILGKELEEQRAKEEQDRLEKEKLEREKLDKERKEKKERGEEVEPSVEETEKTDKEIPAAKAEDPEDEEKKKKKAEKKERRMRKNDDDDASWDGESSVDSEDEINSDEEDKTVVIKDKADSIEEIKDVSELISDKVTTGKSDNYFDCSLGKFFINIGLNFVQEYVQNDLLKQQNRKLYREKKAGHSTKATESSITSLMKNLEFSKENNAPYRYPQIKCEFCSFKTESMLVMAHHLETPHMKNNVYKCNFCAFEIRSPHDILYHMEAEHNTRGKLERAPAYHQCANCPFEDNGKGKLARHLIPCAKKFKPEVNLAPPIEWEPPAKIPKITRSRNSMLGYQGGFGRAQVGNNMVRAPMNMASLMSGVGVGVGLGAGNFRARGRAPAAAPPRAPMIRGVMVRHTTPAQNNNKNAAIPKAMHQPSISITPLPRQPQPPPAPSHHAKSTFVICEICDGYIKDLEQLRNHMQWIHKVKIHPKMIYNRPPLNCQKCQFRFFTDQGLERHLLGSHGLVTSSMQEAANKGKDAGRCPVCGRVYQWKLLNHVARDHNLTLKPAHLSYKCTVCTATFGMYKQFENHVYSAHSVVAKRVMDKSKAAPAPKNDSLLKPLKINDEITIIPQPVKAATPTPANDK